MKLRIDNYYQSASDVVTERVSEDLASRRGSGYCKFDREKLRVTTVHEQVRFQYDLVNVDLYNEVYFNMHQTSFDKSKWEYNDKKPLQFDRVIVWYEKSQYVVREQLNSGDWLLESEKGVPVIVEKELFNCLPWIIDELLG